MTISTWLPLNNAMAAPFVSYGTTRINCPWVGTINTPVNQASDLIVPIAPLPGNAGTGSWAFSIFWTLPLLPLMAKLFLLKALFLR